MCVSHNAINCSNVFLIVTKEHSEFNFVPQNIFCLLLTESLIYQRYKHHWHLSLNRGGEQRVRSVLSAQTLCQDPRWDNQSRVKELEWLPALLELKPGWKKKDRTKTEKHVVDETVSVSSVNEKSKKKKNKKIKTCLRTGTLKHLLKAKLR